MSTISISLEKPAACKCLIHKLCTFSLGNELTSFVNAALMSTLLVRSIVHLSPGEPHYTVQACIRIAGQLININELCQSSHHCSACAKVIHGPSAEVLHRCLKLHNILQSNAQGLQSVLSELSTDILSPKGIPPLCLYSYIYTCMRIQSMKCNALNELCKKVLVRQCNHVHHISRMRISSILRLWLC